ncbi:MAG: hypothetical protein ACE5ET_07215, partial [Gammaproteobacteria bacterium]
ITQLLVTYSEAVKDTGASAPDGVTNPANYGLTGASGGAIAGLNTVEQSAQFIGNFNDNDRIYAEFKYTF